MKERLEKLQERIDNDPKLKEAIESIKPKRTLWGVLGIVLFFFLPELITFIWQPELVAWSHAHSLTEPSSWQRMLYRALEEMFADGVSWLNITLGVVLLIWMWRAK